MQNLSVNTIEELYSFGNQFNSFFYFVKALDTLYLDRDTSSTYPEKSISEVIKSVLISATGFILYDVDRLNKKYDNIDIKIPDFENDKFCVIAEKFEELLGKLLFLKMTFICDIEERNLINLYQNLLSETVTTLNCLNGNFINEYL